MLGVFAKARRLGQKLWFLLLVFRQKDINTNLHAFLYYT